MHNAMSVGPAPETHKGAEEPKQKTREWVNFNLVTAKGKGKVDASCSCCCSRSGADSDVLRGWHVPPRSAQASIYLRKVAGMSFSWYVSKGTVAFDRLG